MSLQLEPLHNQIAFQFVEDTKKGKFNLTGAGGIIVVESASEQVKNSRWIRIENIGPDVEDYSVGDIVLVENLRWTNMYRYGGEEYWNTADTEILATWGDPDALPSEAGL